MIHALCHLSEGIHCVFVFPALTYPGSLPGDCRVPAVTIAISAAIDGVSILIVCILMFEIFIPCIHLICRTERER